MNNIRKIIFFILLFAMTVISVSAGFAYEEDAALGITVHIRHNINRHMARLQNKNEALLKAMPEEISKLDFNEYDTEELVLGTELYSFDDNLGSVFKYLLKGNIEDEISGEENKVNTLSGSNYKVHSLIGLNGFPELFACNTILRAATGGRAKLVSDFPEEIPKYQVIKNKNNVYVENIDFYNFSTIKFEYCENIIFNNCTFNDFSVNGLVFRDCENISVVNCNFNNCGNAMTDYTNSGYSIRITGDDTNPANNVLIENCVIENACGDAISFVGAVDNFIVRNNKINNSVWSAIDYWQPAVSGEYINIIENNSCVNIGFGEPSKYDTAAKVSGVGCSAIFTGKGMPMAKTIVKNNTIKNAVENGIEGAYELVYHNTIENTGENSAVRHTGSTEGIFITPVVSFEQKYISNVIQTRGLRCISSYSSEPDEYKAIYIIGNSFLLKDTDDSITCKYKRADIEINYPHLKKLVIRGNTGMRCDIDSVNIFIRDKEYAMDYFDLENPCKIGVVPERVKYCYNINVR
ncbi:MAG: hypothetical protein ACI4C7_08800 [Clostridia bacterium]